MKRASVFLALLLAACGSDHDPAPTVATAEVIRGGFTLERDGDAERVIDTARVEEGAEAATAEDGRGGLRLDSGAWILFDHDTRGAVQLASFTLREGRVWVDASSANETTIETEGDDSHEPTLAMLDSMVAELEARWPAEEAS